MPATLDSGTNAALVNVHVAPPPVKLAVAFPLEGVGPVNEFETTVTLADAVLPVPPSTDAIAPVVLFCGPAAVLSTSTAKVHEAAPARLAPERLIEPDPWQ